MLPAEVGEGGGIYLIFHFLLPTCYSGLAARWVAPVTVLDWLLLHRLKGGGRGISRWAPKNSFISWRLNDISTIINPRELLFSFSPPLYFAS